MAFLLPYTIVSQGIYTGLVSTISMLTMTTCSIVKTIYTHQNPDTNKLIIELDLERRLYLVQSVLNVLSQKDNYNTKINDLEKTQIFNIMEKKEDLALDPIELCLKYIHQTVKNINLILKAINDKVAYHQTKWFYSWRTLNVKPLLDTLQMHSKLLDSRFDDLTKISNFLTNRQIKQ